MPHCVAAYAACLRVGLEGSGVSLRLLQLLSATPDACAGSGGVCARVCEMRIVAGWLLLMWASVLCVRRCAGVRCARAVRVCVLESRVSLRVLRARRRVLCAVLCCAPVCVAVRRRIGWQGCAVGCGVLRSRARLCVLRARRRCVLCAVLCCAPCLCSWEAQAWLAGLRGGLRRAAGGRAPA